MKRVLVIAPHCDDEVLGVGGSICKWVAEGHHVSVAVITGHGSQAHPLWPKEHWTKIHSEFSESASILGIHESFFIDLPASCLDSLPIHKVNESIVKLLHQVQPSEVYVPFYHDLHKDHQTTAYASFVALRPYLSLGKSIKRILAYETLLETHLFPPGVSPAFTPNIFCDISPYMSRKLAAMSAYKSQLLATGPRSLPAIEALALFRGSHIGCKYAESFLLLGEYIR